MDLGSVLIRDVIWPTPSLTPDPYGTKIMPVLRGLSDLIQTEIFVVRDGKGILFWEVIPWGYFPVGDKSFLKYLSSNCSRVDHCCSSRFLLFGELHPNRNTEQISYIERYYCLFMYCNSFVREKWILLYLESHIELILILLLMRCFFNSNLWSFPQPHYFLW